jgi:hypothetical protein
MRIPKEFLPQKAAVNRQDKQKQQSDILPEIRFYNLIAVL